MSTAYHEGTVQPRNTTRRRQNRSCDQCRLSKRACDASRLPRTRTDGVFSEFHAPCTYCVKTNKKCTTVKADLHTLAARNLNRLKETSGASIGYYSAQCDIVRPEDTPTDIALGCFAQSDLTHNVEQWSWVDWDGLQLSTGEEATSQLPVGDVCDEMVMVHDGQLPTGDSHQTFSPDANIRDPFSGGCAVVHSADIDYRGPDDCNTESSQASEKHVFSTAESNCLSNLSTQNSSRGRRSTFGESQSGLSPFSIDHRVSTSFHRQMTSSNLLKIYHDVLEHHLSCWVAETTCPYQQSPQPADVGNIATPEWSASWTNRILQRTIRLDHVAQSCKLLYLTPSQRKAASNALNLAVSAFATQWAQGSIRARRKYSARSQDMGDVEAMSNMMEEFDRTLQQYFWNQTHRALKDVEELDCYQVACAELIFSLAQRPWQPETLSQSPVHETPSAESIRSQVQCIIERDGPPIYSERAARRMHTLKFKCDSYNKGLGSKHKKLKHGIASMAREDRDTIGLLYWLAIMFDTVAASMYERPVVVTDEECRYEVRRDVVPLCDTNLPYRWDYEIFLQTSGEISHRTSWPCSYDRAAEDVTRSAPVKVLLFRHVSYLQNALRKSATPHQLEDIIFNTMLIYDYWNRTHGRFFKEMVQDFANVPQRIRGWFICISAHWHLAVLMFADLLELMHENNIGLEETRHERSALSMTGRLRGDSCRELSDLGHVATLPTYLSTPREDSPDFHHAVTEGTILTEPWTMILIRAFSQASVFFLEKAKMLCETRGTLGFVCEFKTSLRDASNCIKALWLLGKKSDMAWDLAEALQQALRGLQSGFVWHIM